jgi:hypothetical protein
MMDELWLVAVLTSCACVYPASDLLDTSVGTVIQCSMYIYKYSTLYIVVRLPNDT